MNGAALLEPLAWLAALSGLTFAPIVVYWLTLRLMLTAADRRAERRAQHLAEFMRATECGRITPDVPERGTP